MQDEHQQQQQQLKLKQQQQHIKKLLSTADAGRGIIEDLDASPIHRRESIVATNFIKHPLSDSENMPTTLSMMATNSTTPPPIVNSTKPLKLSKKRPPERNLWRLDEINAMLDVMDEINAVELLFDRGIKSEKIFRNVERIMFERGFRKKSYGQIWTKWKFLKTTYMTSRRNGGVVPKILAGEIYGRLCKMLGNAKMNSSSKGNSEYENSQTSMDDDNSGGSQETNQEETMENEASKDLMSMPEHPIFGFNLALVKAEPSDAGYDTLNSNGLSMADSPQVDQNLSNNLQNDDSLLMPMPSVSIVKPEPFEYQQTYQKDMRSTTTTTPPKSARNGHSTQLSMPKSTKSITITPIPVDISREDKRSRMESATRTANSSLRIAQFAKEQPILANVLQNSQRPLSPPPLALSSSAIVKRKLENSDNIYNMKKKPRTLTSQSAMNLNAFNDVLSHHQASLLMPKDIDSIQYNASGLLGNRPLLKPSGKHSNGMRSSSNTAVSDMYQEHNQFNSRAYQELMTNGNPPAFGHYDTSLLDIQSSKMPPMKSKKRLASFDRNVDGTKIDRNSKPFPIILERKQAKLDSVMGGGAMSAEDFRSSRYSSGMDSQFMNYSQNDIYDSRATASRRNTQRSHNPTMEDIPHASEEHPSREQREMFENVLKDIVTSIRETQREMLADFFQKQMEMARRDHEFQMRQDAIVMQAFYEQREEFMKTAKELLSQVNTLKRKQSKKNKRKKIPKSTSNNADMNHVENLIKSTNQTNQNRNTPQSKDIKTNNYNEIESETTTTSSSSSGDENDDDDDNDDDNDDDDDNHMGEGEGEEMPTSTRLSGISQRDLRNLRLKTNIPEYADGDGDPEADANDVDGDGDDDTDSDSDSNEIFDSTTNSNNHNDDSCNVNSF